MTDGIPIDDHLTVGQFLTCVAPEIWSEVSRRKALRGNRGAMIPGDSCPHWPGDVFACAAALLERSGAYTLLGLGCWPPAQDRRWYEKVGRLAKSWRRAIAQVPFGQQIRSTPAEIREYWRRLIASKATPVNDISRHKELSEALISLIAICDATFEGVGLGRNGPSGTRSASEIDTIFALRCDLLLLRPHQVPNSETWDFESSLCERIPTSRLRVLPKSQSPKSGLSLRSLTHHIAFCPPTNLSVRWHSAGLTPNVVGDRTCNFLLVPWPFRVKPTDFSVVSCDRTLETGWFRYVPQQFKVGEVIETVERLVEKASDLIGRLHVVVLPELALTQLQYEQLRSVLLAQDVGIIAGIADSRSGSSQMMQNYASAAFPEGTFDPSQSWLDFRQDKHHRWRLDASQIVRYGLAERLDPNLEWWEGIHVHDRSLNFIVLREWLSTCVLICEDLARIDPVGRFVRAVGPDLVIALLMDGPQLRDRWPAYHATVLTDDPGSSVLTLTSLGMLNASQPPEMIGKPHRRTIALWRDSHTGIVEIDLPTGMDAALLTLSRQSVKGRTADGRMRPEGFGGPRFGGVQFLSVAD